MEVVTHQSWFSRIGGAVVGVIVGILLSLAAFPVLFLNEGRAVKTARALKEGAKSVVSVDAAPINDQHEGQFVHVVGDAHVELPLADEPFGVEEPAVRLTRTVEMYQWDESKDTRTRNKTGGGTETVTTYSYHKVWAASPISSSSFHDSSGHQNPTRWPIEGVSHQARDVTLGAFDVPQTLVEKIDQPEPVEVQLDAVTQDLAANLTQDAPNGFYWSTGGSPENPVIGDTRIRFTATRPGTVSVMAQQHGRSLDPYTTSNGRELYMLSMGNVSSADMIAAAEMQNRILTWVVRFVGTLMMFIGFVIVMRPLKVVADVIPFIGSIVGAGTGVIAALAAGSLAFLTIGAGWVTYRPLVGVPLLLASVALSVLLVKRLRRAGPAPVTHTVPPPLPS